MVQYDFIWVWVHGSRRSFGWCALFVFGVAVRYCTGWARKSFGRSQSVRVQGRPSFALRTDRTTFRACCRPCVTRGLWKRQLGAQRWEAHRHPLSAHHSDWTSCQKLANLQVLQANDSVNWQQPNGTLVIIVPSLHQWTAFLGTNSICRTACQLAGSGVIGNKGLLLTWLPCLSPQA